jgi:hypothetical protein
MGARVRCDKCRKKARRVNVESNRRTGYYHSEKHILKSEEFQEAQRKSKAKRHKRAFRDVLARCAPPRTHETIPAEAYRAYDALLDLVLARAGFKGEPLPPALEREIRIENERCGPLIEVQLVRENP